MKKTESRCRMLEACLRKVEPRYKLGGGEMEVGQRMDGGEAKPTEQKGFRPSEGLRLSGRRRIGCRGLAKV
jgi:hypothetical protein